MMLKLDAGHVTKVLLAGYSLQTRLLPKRSFDISNEKKVVLL